MRVASCLCVVLALVGACDDGDESGARSTDGGGAPGGGGAESGGSAGAGGAAGSSGGASGDADADSPGPILACSARVVSTLAGKDAGFQEGSAGPEGIARLDGVKGLAVYATVAAFVADRNNQRVRILLLDGSECDRFAGNGTPGLSDGDAELSALNAPEGVASDEQGVVYVADTGNHALRRVQSGKLETLAGGGAPGFDDGPPARFHHPTGVAVAPGGVLFVSDRDNHAVRRRDAQGNVTTLAGDGTPGFADGTGISARFSSPWGIALGKDGVLWVSDTGNDRIRKLDPAGNVTTFAGGDGSLEAPMGLALSAEGLLYVADSGHQRVLRYLPDGTQELVAGNGNTGFRNGPAASAEFSELAGLALSDAYAGGGLLVADAHQVRLIHCP